MYRHSKSALPIQKEQNLPLRLCVWVWCVALVNCSIITVFAQQYSALTYGVEEGLGASKVFTFYQDRLGYLWVSTAAGLSRFDGKQFTNYTLKDGVTSYQISSVHEDTMGNLWFKSLQYSNSRLLRYDGRKFYPADTIKVFGTGSIYFHRDQIEPLWIKQNNKVEMIHPHRRFSLLMDKEQLRDNYIYDIWEIDSTHALLATQLGFMVYQNGVYLNLTKQQKRNTQVYQITRYKGNWWLQTDEGLWIYNGKFLDNSIIPPELQRNVVQIMLPDAQGNLWFGTVIGLFKYDGDCFKRYTTQNGMITNRIATMMIDSKNRIWLISEQGLMVFKDERFEMLDHEKAGFLGPGKGFRLRHIMEDREGNVWVTSEQGLTRYSSFAFLQFRYGAELPYTNANAALVDSQNMLWVGGDEPNGLSVCSMPDVRCNLFADALNRPVGSIYDLLEDPKGNVWIADGGVTVFNGQRFEPVNFDPSPLDKFIGLLAQDSKGNVWLGSNNGVYMQKNRTFTYYELQTNADGNLNPIYGFNPYNNIRCMLIDHNDSVWVAAQSGVYILRKGSFAPVGGKRFFGTVKQMAEDTAGNIWMIKEEGGLLRYNGKEVVQFDERDGLGSSLIYSITITGGYAWLATANGLDRFDVNLFNQTQKISVIHIGKAEGFTQPECTPMNYTDKQGNLWLGGKNGITRFNPALLHTNAPNLPLYITEVKLHYESVDWIAFADSLNPTTRLPHNLQLSHHENTLTFLFDALSFSNRQQIRYFYRLTGTARPDTAWLPAPTEQTVSFANLKSGKYRFELKAYHTLSPDAVSFANFTFTILPPVWYFGKFWLWMGVAALGCITIYIALKHIANILYRRRLEAITRAVNKVQPPQ